MAKNRNRKNRNGKVPTSSAERLQRSATYTSDDHSVQIEEESLTNAKTIPELLNAARELETFSVGSIFLRKAFLMGGRDLCGPAPTTNTLRLGGILAFLGLLTQAFTGGTTFPYFVANAGVLLAVPFTLFLFGITNLFQQFAVVTPNQRNWLARVGLVGLLAIPIWQSSLSGYGMAELRFPEDLSNQYAERIVEVQVLAPYQVPIDAAEEKGRYANEVQRECDAAMQDYERLNLTDPEAASIAYIDAKGSFIANEPSDRWTSTPTEELPFCPKAERLKDESQRELLNATKTLNEAKAEILGEYGDNYALYLEEEHPLLWKGGFHPRTGKIRRRKEALKELGVLVETAEPGVRQSIFGFKYISLTTSVLLVALTFFYSNLPSVRGSWNPKTVLEHQRRLRNIRRSRRAGGRSDDE